MAFCGGYCVLCVKINPPTCKSAFLWARKKEKTEKQHCKVQLKIAKVSNIFSAMARFL
jgi:hypothetical protein